MKTPYLTISKIQQAVKFLEKRKTHARGIGNKEWENEFDNAITVIREMAGGRFKLMSDLPEVTGNNLPAKFIEEESWLRQPGETNAAYHAFCLYRDYGGDRSIKKALTRSNTPMSRSGIWQAWSKKNLWVRRSGDYDKHLDNIRRSERENTFREREKKHLAISQKMLDLVEKRLDKFDSEELSQGMMMEWLKNCVSIERESLDSEAEEGKPGNLKQMQISFFEEFGGV